MTPAETGLQALERRHPEWKPWLAVIEGVLAETGNPKWDTVVPARSERQHSKIPLLADATIVPKYPGPLPGGVRPGQCGQ